MEEVTRILEAVEAGDTQAAEQLLPLVYNELRRIAANKMKAERAGHTLQPTALVHEAYLRLLGPDGNQPNWHSRGHFFVAAAEAMRRILIDSIRRKQAIKRGGDLDRTEWDEAQYETEVPADDILAVHEALGSLEKVHPELAKLVLLRYFAGMSIEETASSLDVSPSTVERQWRAARAWLQREISESL
ncbi:MAG: ECF-type sigma factor [Verrucomicrobiales bacterium]